MSNKQETPSVQASGNSNAVGSISVGGDISGNIHIGNVGFSPDEVAKLLTQISSTFQAKPFDGTCPYKGLDYFEEEDAELFFGREKLVEDLVSRVKTSRTVFITGPSGSGKSSLVRAGLIHALKRGDIKSSERWLYATMKPGRDPIEALALAFSRLKSPELGNYFRQNRNNPGVLHECAESALGESKNQRLVLFMDQFEEVFTQISREEERMTFLNLLTHAMSVENGRVILLFAMRSDFVPNCAVYPDLNATLNRQFIQIGAMQPEELVSAIAQPALRVGLRIDPDLIAQIINDMKGEPGSLPLMQFALKDLFEAMQAKGGLIQLTLSDYLQRGGIQKALERHANTAFQNLAPGEQELARSIFSGLIEIGRGTQDTKRTAIFDELVPANAKSDDIETIVRKLADARLITTDEVAGKDTVTISHEKLIDAWPWLKKLVNENRDVIALQNEIVADAKEWEDHKRDASYLYSGARLANAREKIKDLILNGAAYDFLKTSIKVEEDALLLREQQIKKEQEFEKYKLEEQVKQIQDQMRQQQKSRYIFFAGLGITLIMSYILSTFEAPLKTAYSPNGLTSLAFSGNIENAHQIINSWDGNSILYAVFILGFNFSSAVVYSTTLWYACKLASEQIHKRWRFGALIGNWLAWGQVIAGIVGLIGNIALLQMLFVTLQGPWPQTAYWSFSIRFGVMYIGILYAIIASLFGANRKPKIKNL